MTTSETALPLAELLRRSHRDELLPLARALSVNPEGLGLSQLATALDLTLRRAGGHVLVNILRGGQGPPYGRTLRRVARLVKLKVAPDANDEVIEMALLSASLRAAWERLEPTTRSKAWGVLGMDGEPPTNGRRALDVAKGRLGRSTGYQIAAVLAGSMAARVVTLALLPLAPLGVLGAVWWFGRPRLDSLLPAIVEVARLRQIVRHRITIGIVGSPSSGKDAALKALFGVDTGNVHPIAGSTREVAIHRVQGATALYVVNTPGLGDVEAAVNEETKQVLDHIDLYLYLVNAQGGVQAREKADWDRVVASGRPALAVLNKVDTLRERDRPRLMADVRARLGIEDRQLLAVAFDPLPQLEPAPLGVDGVRAWLREALGELGKDITELQPGGAAPSLG